MIILTINCVKLKNKTFKIFYCQKRSKTWLLKLLWHTSQESLLLFQNITSLKGGHSKSTFVNERKGGSFFFKKNAEIFKMKFYSSPTVFAIDHNEDWFFCTLLLYRNVRSFLCTVHYFLCVFSAKMAAYSLVIETVYFMISS